MVGENEVEGSALYRDVYFSIRHELCIYPVLLVGVMGNSRLGIESGHGTDIPILYRRK